MKSQRPKRDTRSRYVAHEDNTCPTPGKLSFTSSEHAEQALRYNHHEGRTHKPQRAYRCPCGSWHWSSTTDY